jgi:hypothetical protein
MMSSIFSLRNSTLLSLSSTSTSTSSSSSSSSSSATAAATAELPSTTMQQHMERKKRLWNSRSQFHPTPNRNNDDDDDDWLQSSLKRVRISTCPGELRLDRDIQQWMMMMQKEQQQNSNNNHWMTKVSLERNHALGIIVHIDGMARIQLQFPRLYPHVSPWICSMEGAILNSTNVPFITTHYQSADATTTTWSPIMTLCDYIPILLQNISLKTTTTTSTNTIPTAMSIEETSIPSKHLLFSPNRFNHGYNYSSYKDENSDHHSSLAITYKSSFPSRTLHDTTRLDNNDHDDDSSSSCCSQDMEL